MESCNRFALENPEACQLAPRLVGRRAGLVWELAEEVRLGTDGLKAKPLETERVFEKLSGIIQCA